MTRFSVECPGCRADLSISELTCQGCGAKVSGTFAPCALCRLPREEADLALVFLQTGGSLKEVEKLLGISYPTVRSLLDSMIRRLKADEAPRESPKKRRAEEILDRLETGAISAAEATRLLEELRAKSGTTDRAAKEEA